MSNYKWQPDFVITIDGKDVSKDTLSWEVNDVDDGISNVRVALVNKKYDFTPKAGSDLTIRFGYQGDLSEPITMRIQKRTNKYGTRGAFIEVIGEDCLEAAMSNSMRGAFLIQDVPQICKEIGESIHTKVELGDMTSPLSPEGFKYQCSNERIIDAMRRHLAMCIIKERQGARGGVPSAATNKAIKNPRRAKTPPSFKGDVGPGFKAPSGPLTKEEIEQDKAAMKAIMEDIVARASSISFRAILETLGVPSLKGKTVVRVENVGEDSGNWYVKGVCHSWSVGRGYTTRCDLLVPTQNGDKPPKVCYAKIYEKDSIYVGPRKDDQGPSHTFVYGRDDKRIINFKATESLPEAKAAGEAGEDKGIITDDAANSGALEYGNVGF